MHARPVPTSDAEARALILADHEAFWLSFAAADGRERHAGPDVAWMRTGLASPRYNAVVRARFDAADADARVDALVAAADARGLPLGWSVRPDSAPNDLATRLAARGFEPKGEEVGMWRDLAALPEPPETDVEVRPVRDETGMDAWARVLQLAFGIGDDAREVVRAAHAPRALGGRVPGRYYVAFADGTPVATSVLFTGAGVAGLYGVGTIPDARRRGLGAALTLRALADGAREGCRVATLQATPLGRPVYERLGFRAACTLTFHARAARAGGSG